MTSILVFLATKGFIDRLHVNFDILVILFPYFFWYVFFMRRELVIRSAVLSHDFEQFGSLHMCAQRKDIGRSGI